MKEGGCHCGSVTYEHSGTPLACYACHCTDCQSASGTAFTLVTVAFENEVKLTSGELSLNTYERSGTVGSRYHCSNCGSTLWRSAADIPGVLLISSGTFSDTSNLHPSVHLWSSSALPWVSFEGLPNVFPENATAEQLLSLHAEYKNA